MATSAPSLLWPELYGFSIYGNGPTYVIYVEPSSISDLAGIRAGDRIIEIDNQDVSKLSANIIKYMARNSKNSPPSLSVQSATKVIDLIPDYKLNYLNLFGFSVKNNLNDFEGKHSDSYSPIVVDQLVDTSQAYLQGLRPGDLIIEINGKRIKSNETALVFLNSNKNLSIRYIQFSNEILNKNFNSLKSSKSLQKQESTLTNEAKVKRAKKFFTILNDIMIDEPEKQQLIMNELKAFSETGDVHALAANLNQLIKHDHQRVLFDEIKPFIPARQQLAFENLTKPQHKPSPELVKPTFDDHSIIYTSILKEKTRLRKPPFGRRRIMIRRNGNESIGITLRGSRPAVINSIVPNSPADFCGFYENDVILSINDIDVENKNHKYLVDFLQSAGQNPILEVIQKCEYDEINSMLTGSSSLSSCSSNSIFEIKNYEGKTFREKVKELFGSKEREKFKKILRDYKSKKDIDDFLKKASKLLNESEAKKELWFYLMPIIDENHVDYARTYLNKIASPMSTFYYKSCTPSLDANDLSNHACGFQEVQNRTGPHLSHQFKNSKSFGSAPSMLQVYDTANFMQDKCLVDKFTKQLDYLMNAKEKSKIEYALNCYKYDRNILVFVETINTVLDTPAKKSLWFHIIPLLDEDDQEYCKRRLFLATGNIFTLRSRSPCLNYLTHNDCDTKASNYSGAKIAHSNSCKPRSVSSSIRNSLGRRPLSFAMTSHHYDESTATREENAEVITSYYEPNVCTMSRSSSMYEVRNKTQKNNANRSYLLVNNKISNNNDQMMSRFFLNATYKNNSVNNNSTQIHNLNIKLLIKPIQDSFKQYDSNKNYVNTYYLPQDLNINNTTSSKKIHNEKNINNKTHLALVSSKEFKKNNQKSKYKNHYNIDNTLEKFTTNQTIQSPNSKNSPVLLSSHSSPSLISVPSLPPPPPPPPPPPLPPLSTTQDLSLTSSDTLLSKRINWEKIENKSLQGTVWEKFQLNKQDLNEIITNMNLNEFFTQQQASSHIKKSKSVEQIKILSDKKAYNIGIILGFLKHSQDDIFSSLLQSDSNFKKILTLELVKHLLQYSPDDDEIKMFQSLSSDESLLTQADKFMIKLIKIPDYKIRLEVLLFIYEFDEKYNELNLMVNILKQATDQVKNSQKFKNIIQLILVIGNHLNRGNARLSDANAFKLNVLPQLDQTKLTSSGNNSTTINTTRTTQANLLNLLARLCQNQYPDSLNLRYDFQSIEQASKIPIKTLNTEINELKSSFENCVNKLEKEFKSNDSFKQHLINELRTKRELVDELVEANLDLKESFSNLVNYFGETESSQLGQSQVFFTTLNEFMLKFEKAHASNKQTDRRFSQIITATSSDGKT